MNEGTQQIGFLLQGAGVPATDDGKPIHVGASQIRQGLGFEVAPDVLNRIELGSVGREVKRQRLRAIEKGRDHGTPVRLRAIPHQDHGSAEMAGKLLDEEQHGRGIEGRVDEQLKIQADRLAVGADTEGGDHRDLLPVAATLPEHGRVPAPAPGASHYGQQEQPALVDEHQPSVQSAGFF